MTRRTPQIAPVVVKRAAEERKRLPPELEAFARSDEERLRIRKPRQDRGKVNDPREGYTIPGVANRDARTVYDQRVLAMQKLWNEGTADERALEDLGTLLFDAQRLELWRARRVMDFEAFVEEVVGVPIAQAQALAEAATLRLREVPGRLSERDVALWLRTEAGLFEGDLSANVRIATAGGVSRLTLTVALEHVSDALSGAGARHMPLARPLEERLAGPAAGQGAAPRAGKSAENATPARRDDAPDAEESQDSVTESSDRTPAWKPAPDLEGGARLLTRKARPEQAEEGERGGSPEPRKFERPQREGRDGPVARGEGRSFGGPREGAREGQGQARFARPRDEGRSDERRAERPVRDGGNARGGRSFEGAGARRAPFGRGDSSGPSQGSRTSGAGQRGSFGEKREFGGKREGGFGQGAGQRGGFGEKREFGKQGGGGFGKQGGGGFGKREGGGGFGKREGGGGFGKQGGGGFGKPGGGFGKREGGGGFGKQGGGFGKREGGGFGKREGGGGFGKQGGGKGGFGQKREFGGGGDASSAARPKSEGHDE